MRVPAIFLRVRRGMILPLVCLVALIMSACVAAAPAGGTTAPAAEATTAPAAEAPAAAPGEKVMTGAWVGPCCNPIEYLDPMSAGGAYHWHNKIYSRLVTYNLEYTEIVPDLAESWSISDDSLTWTFNLR